MSNGFWEFECLDCNGEGSVEVHSAKSSTWETCPGCGGAGRVLLDPEDGDHLDYVAAGITPLSTPDD